MHSALCASRRRAALTRRGLTVALLLAAFAVTGHGPDLRAQRAALPPDLEMVPADAVGFASLRLGDVWKGDVGKSLREDKQVWGRLMEMEKGLGFGLTDIDRVVVALSFPEGVHRVPSPLFVLTMTKPYEREKILKALAPPEPVEHTHKGKSYYTSGKAQAPPALAVAFLDKQVIVLASPPALRLALDRGAGAEVQGPLARALRQAASTKSNCFFAVDPAPFLREFPKDLPPEAQPFKPLLNVQFITQTMELGKDIRGELILHFAREDQARAGAKALSAVLDLVRPGLAGFEAWKDHPQLANLVQEIQSSLKNLEVQPTGSQVKLALRVDVSALALVALVPIVQELQHTANRLSSVNNLKQIGLAMHNYEATHGHMPLHAIHDKDGKPLLSWRVAVLPFVEQDQLYREFKLDEPWDSPHNKKLLARMPKLYAVPGVTPKEPYSTHYQVFTGKDTVFNGPNKMSFGRIPDGTANTLLAVEAREAVPWTKPDDLPYDPNKPLPSLGDFFRNGTNGLFCDGSVRLLSRSMTANVLRALITASGGEVIEQKDLPQP